jgi:ABC-type polysaccharide/polyol phosphate transport system ATPase subunit
MTPAIRIEGLGKRYRLGEAPVVAQLLRDRLMSLGARARRTAPRVDEVFWALRDVSFDVRHGEVVGVIGRNGAGKSTLLKILSRITAPTEGGAEIRGRVGSLLEVGTGFHPELTGRENIYLNGAIIGMRRREIDRKFDQIVAFAEVERFLDTPIKHYSSGMYVRLAFAVAAHLEPDVLLVDEVLSVGDAQFQRKCLGKMDEVARGGRTVMFISHQLTQVRRLCERVVWLDAGRVRAIGETADVVAQYESGVEEGEAGASRPHYFLRWSLADGGNVLRARTGPVAFRVGVNVPHPVSGGHVGFHVAREDGLLIGSWAFDDVSLKDGLKEFVIEVPDLPIRPGSYTVSCSLFDQGNNLTGGRLLEHWHGVPRLVVQTMPVGHPQDAFEGILNLPASFTVQASGGFVERPAESSARSGV